MGWEQRGNRLYYYSKRRIGARVVSEYVGKGEDVELMAQLEVAYRDRRDTDKGVLRARREADAELDRQLNDLSALVGLLTDATLVACGFHRHKGQWRRKRMGTEIEKVAQSSAIEPVPVAAQASKLTWDQAADILQKHINSTKLTAKERAEVKRALEDQPGLWRAAGDMAVQVQNKMIARMVSQPVAEMCIEEGLEKMRKELDRPNASMVEKLLIDQVLTCWLNMYEVQHHYTMNMSGNITLAQGAYWEKRLTSAQGRYMRVIETLTRVRRLSAPLPVQVNIGGQQINMVKP